MVVISPNWGPNLIADMFTGDIYKCIFLKIKMLITWTIMTMTYHAIYATTRPWSINLIERSCFVETSQAYGCVYSITLF